MSQLLLGLDVGGSKCAAVLGTAIGDVTARVEWRSDTARGPAAMIADLLANARSLMDEHGQAVRAGVSIGGPLDAERGIILSPPNLPGWDEIPLKAQLAEALSMPVSVEHDAAACALAEYRWGAGRGASRLIYLTCGTGFGAGIVIDGKIYRGANGSSLEIGHVRLREDGPVAFGKKGSAEAFCAGASLPKLAAFCFPARWENSPPDGAELARLAMGGDAEADEVLGVNASAVGEVCAMLGDVFRPDRILLGSLSRYLGELWVERVRKKFVAEVLATTAAACAIMPAGLGKRLQDCSALVVAESA